MLLRNLQGMLPQIDQYVPERGQAVRQKLTELGMGNNSTTDFANQMRNVMQQGDSESLAAAASTAPAPIQSRLYQEAATRAVDEGNTERALQLANDHLDESGRASVMQAIDFKKMTTTVSEAKLNEIRHEARGASVRRRSREVPGRPGGGDAERQSEAGASFC